MISIYTTGFNLEKININFDEVFSNWLVYANEIVLSTFQDEIKTTVEIISKSKFYDSKKIKVVALTVDIENDVYWEGKLKNFALENCTNSVVLQCDLDERVSGDPKQFEVCRRSILDHDFSCSVMLPTMDLYEDLDHYINLGKKWYLHTKKGTFRGSVNWARKEDGSLDPEKSDTCELIDAKGNLIPCIANVEYSSNDYPKIIHLGYLDLDKKNCVNEFWGKIWNHRSSGSFDPEYKMEKVTSGDPRKKKHNLSKPLWPTL